MPPKSHNCQGLKQMQSIQEWEQAQAEKQQALDLRKEAEVQAFMRSEMRSIEDKKQTEFAEMKAALTGLEQKQSDAAAVSEAKSKA